MKRLLVMAAMILLGFGCVTRTPTPSVQRPTVDDSSEVHWRMYFEDQFNVYGRAPSPPADASDVAWKAYYAERDSYNIRKLRKE
jgi:hypothetical protein